MFKELSNKLNFSLSYTFYKNWGVLENNGTWHGEGVGQAVQEGRADVADLWLIPSFYPFIDFGPSLNRLEFAFLVRRPEQIDFEWKVFMKIFKPIVWIATCISFMLVVAVYHIGLSWNIYHRRNDWTGSFTVVFGHFLMTTSNSISGRGNTRYTVTAWSIFSLLITTSLSTGIVTRLTLPLYTPRIDTKQQLVEGGYYWTVEYYKRLKAAEIRNNMFDDEFWNRQFESKYVFMEEKELLSKIETDEKMTIAVQTYGEDFFIINHFYLLGNKALKKFRRTKGSTKGSHLSYGVKKGSALLEPFTVMTLRFLEAGLPKQWKKEVVRRWPIYDVSELLTEYDIPIFSEPEPLHLIKMQPVFYLLLMGLAFSSLIFFVEISW